MHVPILIGKTSVKQIYLFILPSSKVTLTYMERILFKCVPLYILMCLSMVILQNLKVFSVFFSSFSIFKDLLSFPPGWDMLFAARIILSLFYYIFLKQGKVFRGR